PAARVFAFEPSESTFQRLCDHLCNERRFSAHRLALGERKGDVEFFEYEASFYNSLVPNPPNQPGMSRDGRRVIVPCTTIDVFCRDQKIDEIDVLKIDAERCDLWVLRGAKEMLGAGRVRFVYFEFNNAMSAPGVQESALVSISEFLAPFG